MFLPHPKALRNAMKMREAPGAYALMMLKKVTGLPQRRLSREPGLGEGDTSKAS